jgi:hypothetical protein
VVEAAPASGAGGRFTGFRAGGHFQQRPKVSPNETGDWSKLLTIENIPNVLISIANVRIRTAPLSHAEHLNILAPPADQARQQQPRRFRERHRCH